MQRIKHILSIVALVMLSTIFNSCDTKDDDAVPSKPIISIADTGNGVYAQGSKAKFTVTATIPVGLKTLVYTKTIDGTESQASSLTIATQEATSLTAVPFEVDVTEAEGKTVTITVKVTDQSGQAAAGVITYKVAASADAPLFN